MTKRKLPLTISAAIAPDTVPPLTSNEGAHNTKEATLVPASSPVPLDCEKLDVPEENSPVKALVSDELVSDAAEFLAAATDTKTVEETLQPDVAMASPDNGNPDDSPKSFQLKILDENHLITSAEDLSRTTAEMSSAIGAALKDVPPDQHVNWLVGNFTKSYHRTLAETLCMAVFCHYASLHMNAVQQAQLKASARISNSTYTALKKIGGNKAIHEIGDKLPPHSSSLYAIARMPTAKFSEAVAKEIIHPKMIAKDLEPFLTKQSRPSSTTKLIATVKLPKSANETERQSLKDAVLKVIEEHGYHVDFG